MLLAIELCGSNRMIAAEHLEIGYSTLKTIAGPQKRKPPPPPPRIEPLKEATARFESRLIMAAVARARGDKRRAAKALGIAYSTIKMKLAPEVGQFEAKLIMGALARALGNKRDGSGEAAIDQQAVLLIVDEAVVSPTAPPSG